MNKHMTRYTLAATVLSLAALALAHGPARGQTSGAAPPSATAPAANPTAAAASLAPDALVKQVSTQVLEAARADKAIQAGDLQRVMALVDSMVLPHVNFERMTSMAMARHWARATPEQRAKLQDQFKTLLVRTYAGALSKVTNQTLDIKPMRARPEDTEVVVRTLVRGGKGDPVQLDYRLAKEAAGWKIYDVNILGAWLVENYRNTFNQEINASGIDGLITKLAERNKVIATRKSDAGKPEAARP